VDDSANPAARNVTVSQFGVTGLSPANISYAPHGLALTLKSGSGNDQFTIKAPPPIVLPTLFPISIDGGAGTNTLIGSDAPSTWTITSANAGSVGTVSFSSIQNLTGGSAINTFALQTGGSLSGTLDGGSGTNTLDYSAFKGNVTVDLPLGTATAVGKGIANIKNVIGSQGNDILVGDANPNVLTGGSGRNLIIGGAAADQIFGGGDDILISGTTAFDNNLAALQAIFTEWTRNDRSFARRIKDLTRGVGSSHQFHLDHTTVFADGAANTLNAGKLLDWFFLHKASDTIKGQNANQKAHDKITSI
jgi:Ca2+-binding RTX toxin-like protein